jgi:adenylate cyclase
MRRLADEMAKIQSFDLDSEVNINTSFLEIKNLRDSFERMRGGLRNFRRYVPADLVGRLVRGEINADLEGEERELTIFCSGIAQFAAVARQMKAGPLVRDLRAYFEAVSTTILENQGTIDQYSGDSVMAFWGAPLPLDNHADLACRSALFIRNNLYNLFQQWTIQGKYPFHTRMGIHTGQVITGNLGYRDRLNYTVIGDAVNVSVRLEELNKVYGTHIIVSEFTRNRCRDSLEFRLLDRVSVAGRGEPFEIYELLALSDIVPASGKPLYQYYETGLRYYFDQKWDEALKYFNTVLKYRPGDAPGKVMRERCLRFMQNPPPPEWNGVFVQSMT